MKRVAVYARVSTVEQKELGTSLETQVQAMLNYAKTEGYEASHTLREDFSGEYLERPELNKAKELAREGQIEALLIYDWDRFSRDSDHQTVLRWMFDRWGVEVISVTEPRLEGIRLKMQRGMDAIFAEWEKEKIRERTTRGRRERARQGKLIGGFSLFGTSYDESTGKRRKDPQTWPILFLIFRLVAGGHSLRKVAKYLNSLAIPSPSGGTVWYTSTMSSIIRNRAYLGETYAFTCRFVEPKTRRKPLTELRHRKTKKEPTPRERWVELPNATPSLIPDELFEAAHERLRTRAATYRVRRYRYLLTGRVRCNCGTRIHGYSCREYRYYRCPGCGARLLKADELEGLAWGEIKRLLLNPELLLAHVETRYNGETDTTSQRERTAIGQRLGSLAMEERRLYRLYSSGRYDQSKLDDELDRVRTERSSLASQARELEARLEAHHEIVERNTSIQEYCRRARENIDSFDFEQKRLAMDALEIQVVVDGKRVALSGVIPIHSAIRTPSLD